MVDPRFAEQIAKDKARQESSAVFRLMKVFDSIDTDHSGVISRAELAQKLKKDDALERVLRMKTDLTPRTLESAHGQTQIDMLLDVMDQRGDGSISWQDFVEGVAQRGGAARLRRDRPQSHGLGEPRRVPSQAAA